MQRFFQTEEHDVVAAAFEFLGLTGGQGDAAFDFAHTHHAVVVHMGVQFDFVGKLFAGGGRNQFVVFILGVGWANECAALGHALHGGIGVGFACFNAVGECGRTH